MDLLCTGFIRDCTAIQRPLGATRACDSLNGVCNNATGFLSPDIGTTDTSSLVAGFNVA